MDFHISLFVFGLMVLHSVYATEGKKEIPPIIQAAETGNIIEIKRLIKSGTDVNTKDDAGMTPLMWASIRNHTKLIQPLLDAGARVNEKADWIQPEYDYQDVRDDVRVVKGETALIRAAGKGNLDIVKMLVNAGADIHASTDFDTTALKDAVQQGHENVVKFLIDAGVRVDQRRAQGSTALMGAITQQQIPLIKMLIKAGTDVNALYEGTHQGQSYQISPLDYALGTNNMTIVKLLLDAGADTKKLNLLHRKIMQWSLTHNGDYQKTVARIRSFSGWFFKFFITFFCFLLLIWPQVWYHVLILLILTGLSTFLFIALSRFFGFFFGWAPPTMLVLTLYTLLIAFIGFILDLLIISGIYRLRSQRATLWIFLANLLAGLFITVSHFVL